MPTDWAVTPQKGIVNKTPFVILVRKGNPKQINDFADLAKAGVQVIHPDPVSSGSALMTFTTNPRPNTSLHFWERRIFCSESFVTENLKAKK